MRLLVIAGAVAVVVGGVAIWFGIPVKEFSFGNTMILAGAMAICSGWLLIGLGLVVRELKAIKRNLRESMPAADPRAADGPPLPAGSIAGWGGRTDRDTFEVRPVAPALRGEAVNPPNPPSGRDGPGPDAARPEGESGKFTAEAAPPAKGRRDLLFSSSRREREKARPGALEAAAGHPAVAEPPTGSAAGRRAEPHPSFNKTPVESAPDTEPTMLRRVETRAPPPPPATVVKSGAVDGMAYSLYSDGSIEAHMPEGMMRFTSIEHLRAHLDRDR